VAVILAGRLCESHRTLPLTDGEDSPGLDHLPHGQQAIGLGGFQQVNPELHSQNFSINRNQRQRGIAAGDIGQTGDYAAMEKAVLLR
jgi:hypothetical protein